MSRTIQLGDLVRVSFDNDVALYRIEKISDTEITIYAIVNPSIKNSIKLVDEADSSSITPKWKFEGTNENVEFIDPNAPLPFTYIYDVDIIILSNLDSITLDMICQVNRYAQTLCQNETLWQ